MWGVISPIVKMTLEQALTAAVVALAGCVGGLFTWFKGQFARVAEKLEECERDREALWARVASLAAASGLDGTDLSAE